MRVSEQLKYILWLVSLTAIGLTGSAQEHLDIRPGQGGPVIDSLFAAAPDCTLGTPSAPSGTLLRCEASGTGTYTSSALNASSYTWSVSPSTAGETNASGGTLTIMWGSGFSGNAVITVTASGCSTTTSNSSTVVVSSKVATPTAPSGSTSVCASSSTTYSTNDASATGYTWALSPVSAGTVTNEGSSASVAWASGGNGSVTLTVSATGCNSSSASASTGITINPSVGTPSAPSGTSSRCEGSGTGSYTTSASNATGYTWSLSPSTAGTISGASTTGTVTWASGFSGTATVSVTASGCGGPSSASSTSVVVTPLVATPSAPSGTTSRCEGSGTGSYTSSATNATSYTWSITPSTAAETSSSGGTLTVNWNSTYSGNAVVQVTANGCNSSTASASTTVAITSLVGTPAPPSGATTVCENNAATSYTTSATNATGYNWSLSPVDAGSVSGSGTTGTVTWASGVSGTVTLTVSASGCNSSSASNSTSITVTPTVGTPSTPGGASGVCQGSGPTNYTSSASNATGYTWSLSPSSAGTITGTGTTGTVTWASGFSGIATVSVAASGCGGPSAAISTSVVVTAPVGNPGVPGGPTSFCEGSNTSAYGASASNATSYTWTIAPSTAGETAENGDSLYVNWNSSYSGNAVITVTAGGCGSQETDSTTVVITPLVGTPAAPSGPQTICQGDSVSAYTDSAPNAGSYVWTINPVGAGTITGSGDSLYIAWDTVFSGQVTITATALGCNSSSASNSIDMTVVGAVGTPNAPAGSDSLCEGSAPTMYTTSATGAASYNWSISPGAAGTIGGTGPLSTVTWASGFGGIATISVSANGCNGPSDTVTTNIIVTTPAVIPAAPSGPTSITYGTPVSLYTTSAENNASEYWSISPASAGTIASNNDTGTVSWQPGFSGTVIISVNANDGCQGGSAAAFDTVTVNPFIPIPDSLNYIRARVITKPGITDTVTADGLTSAYDVRQTITYYDGIGREIQSVQWQATPSLADLVSTTQYDPFGRVTQQYLPYTDNQSTGVYRLDAAVQQPVFYNNYFNNTEGYYYTNTTYELSPLNRVLQVAPPGDSWTGSGRGINTQYLFNTAADSVHIWIITSGETDYPTTSSNYPPGTLSVSQTADENGYLALEYRDLEGQIVLKKVRQEANPPGAHTGWLCTYYVYDDLNDLRCVIPPKAVAMLNTDGWSLGPVTNLCFQYAYDSRKRVILRKLPDAVPEYMVYNLKDLLVLSQNGDLGLGNEWEVTKYDSIDRPLQTGIYTAPSAFTLDQMQQNENNDQTYPESFIVHTQNYYDNYTQTSVPAFSNGDLGKLITPANAYPDPVIQSNQTRGLKTVTMKRLLEAPATPWVTDVDYYDEKGRVIQTYEVNGLTGGADTATSMYDFSGKPLSTYERHNNPLSALTPRTTILSSTQYDQVGRVLQTTKQVNDNGINKTVLAETYDALGRLSQKTLGNNLETLNYQYNIRGWVNGINQNYLTGGSNHYFGMELDYDRGFGTPQYNGNIAAIKWKTMGSGIARAYGYTYDSVNRLVAAPFYQNDAHDGTTFVHDGKVDFSVTNIFYDPDGNITALYQNGLEGVSSAPIDQLVYGYGSNSNQLQTVSDSAPVDTSYHLGDFQDGNTQGNDYAYDAVGNLTKDWNKGIDSIRYNYLNLPDYIGVKGKGTINYVYDAGGTKYEKIVIDSTNNERHDTTFYLGSLVYHNDTLQFLSYDDGRIRYLNKVCQVSGVRMTGMVFDYFLKDHLGNTRMVLTEENDTTAYLATMEPRNAAVEDSLFNNVSTTQDPTPVGFEPSSGGDTSNHYVSALVGNSSGSQVVGPALVLKVMANDTVSACVYGWYQGAVQPPPSGPSTLVNDLINSLTNNVVSQSGTHLISSTPVSSALNLAMVSFVSGVDSTLYNNSSPKAFLNWVLFDNQLNYVTGGATQVPQITTGMSKQVLQASIPVMPQSGYLYIFVSNESQDTVYFNNLDIQHLRGPITEEDHYYPYGLTMAGISDRALQFGKYNKYRYNGKELQTREFAFGTGLEWYDYGARFQDPQLGVWHVIDPKAEQNRKWSPYSYGLDNPLRFLDPDGMSAEDWVKSKKTGQYVWMNNVTSTNTPAGYSYVGHDDVSILKDLGWNITYNTGTVTSIGYIASDAENPEGEKPGYGASHIVKTQVSATVTLTPVVNTSFNAKTGEFSREFLGVSVNILTTARTTGSDEVVADGQASLIFNGYKYTTPVSKIEGDGSTLSDPETQATNGSILIPASQLSPGATFPGTTVNTNLWHITEDGAPTPVVTHPLWPVPKTYTNVFLPYTPTKNTNTTKPTSTLSNRLD